MITTKTKPVPEPGALEVRLARGMADLEAAQRLRYRVFIEELGAPGGPTVDHQRRLERDALDPYCDHLLLVDRRRDMEAGDHVVGAYRLLTDERARALGRFYCDSEYDLAPLRGLGRKLVELGRSCVEPEHRRGAAMLLLWKGLADYVLGRGIEVMFGVASFHGADAARHAMALSYLHHAHLAPAPMRVRALDGHFHAMNQIAPDKIDPQAALAAIPPLIRAYLRLGGFVGEGAYIDHEFNTTDVCLIMDTSAMSDRHFDYYTRKALRA
ncbi:MAG: ornithine-acyl[acyl carrier protein] N-acyltransferase [Rhodobacteraceae bacterium HLUCCA12]|nr:MAG: ornithine-acyl[acyl carrier protein] N-acyltransferase [Rhodobacteraceae bacterium HLUCCA12]